MSRVTRARYTVVSTNRGGALTLRDSTGSLLPRPVPPSHCKKVGSNVATDDSDEVEAVINHRGNDLNRYYLVKWRGDPNTSWVHRQDFDDTACITEYFRRLGKRPPPPSPLESVLAPASRPVDSAPPIQASPSPKPHPPAPAAVSLLEALPRGFAVDPVLPASAKLPSSQLLFFWEGLGWERVM